MVFVKAKSTQILAIVRESEATELRRLERYLYLSDTATAGIALALENDRRKALAAGVPYLFDLLFDQHMHQQKAHQTTRDTCPAATPAW